MNRWFPCLLVGTALGVLSVLGASSARAQCDTCATPYAAYQPTLQTTYYQPTVAYQPYTGWYPGKLLDRLRLSRWTGATQAAPVYTAAYASAPTAYTAGYAPASIATTPYLTSYAPLQRTSTVYRPVIMRPVVAMQQVSTTSSCDPCCGGCASCEASSVGASYVEPAAYYDQSSSGCASCAGSSSGPVYSAPSGTGSGVITGPYTGQPSLASPPAQSQSNFPPGTSAGGGGNGASPSEPPLDPQPLPETPTGENSSYYHNNPLQAPQLLSPTTDRTASQPTVDVWNAVYRKPAAGASAPVSRTTARATSTGASETRRPQTQVERDAAGWVAVPRDRQASR